MLLHILVNHGFYSLKELRLIEDWQLFTHVYDLIPFCLGIVLAQLVEGDVDIDEGAGVVAPVWALAAPAQAGDNDLWGVHGRHSRGQCYN